MTISKRIVYFVFISLAACSETALLDLTVVVPLGEDPLANVDSVLLTVSEPFAQVATGVSNPAKLSVGAEIDVEGAIGFIRLEGFRDEERLARGQTPPLILVAQDASMSLLVSSAGAMATLAPQLEKGGAGMNSLLLPGLGVLLTGGMDSDSGPLTNAALYDFVDHRLIAIDAMPESRFGANALSCGETCGLILFGKKDDTTLATRWLRYDGDAWQSGDLSSQASLGRSHATAIQLTDGRYLVVGGKDSEGGPRGDLLLVDAGSESVSPSFSTAPVETAKRVAPGVAVNRNGDVLIVGGATEGQQAELYSSSARTISSVVLSEMTTLDGAAVVALADDTFVVLGGRDGSGNALRSAWRVDAGGEEKQYYAEALAEGRYGHWAGIVSGDLVVIGGTGENSSALAAEVLSSATMERLYSAEASTFRSGQNVARLSSASLLVAGGLDEKGEPVLDLQVFQPR
jgi:hypothetical protein